MLTSATDENLKVLHARTYHHLESGQTETASVIQAPGPLPVTTFYRPVVSDDRLISIFTKQATRITENRGPSDAYSWSLHVPGCGMDHAIVHQVAYSPAAD